jgi:hypothetical protein
MGSAASMKTTPAMGPAATARLREAMESPAASHWGASMITFTSAEPAASMETFAAVPPALAMPSTSAIETAAAVITPSAIESMEPRARANEYAAHEIIRAVVAVRRARVRSIIIVAIYTCRGRTDVSWPSICGTRVHRPDPNSKPDLRLSGSCRNHENSQKYRIF